MGCRSQPFTPVRRTLSLSVLPPRGGARAVDSTLESLKPGSLEKAGALPVTGHRREHEGWGSETRDHPQNPSRATRRTPPKCARTCGRGHAGACVGDSCFSRFPCRSGDHQVGWETPGGVGSRLAFFHNFIKQEMSRCVNKIHLSWKAARPPGAGPGRLRSCASAASRSA